MTKNLFKWMMALAIVATPMVFTACGDDDTSSSSDDQKTVSYTVSEAYSGTTTAEAKAAVESVRTTLLTTMCSSVGQNYIPTALGMGYAIAIAESDETKMLNELEATYARIKDTDLKGARYTMTLRKGATELGVYSFENNSSESRRANIDFENQTLNSQNFWIGDGEGQFTYTESGVTITGTQGSYNGVPYWSGFAISGRTENTYQNLTPDQYNSVPGGTIYGDKFLVVQGPYNGYECMTFDQPMKVLGLHCTNSAYAYSSMTIGDDHAGGPFTKDDWFSAYITCISEQGDTISTTEVELAKKDAEGEDKILNYWRTVRINAENVKKISFSFDGSRKSNGYLNTPAYMCVDKIAVER